MNADHNPRGGLTVDRDSLHASSEYARQVEAAKRLQERSVNADVEKAVEASRWLPLWLRQCCPACRGYRLELQWCDLCKGYGYITVYLGVTHDRP